MSKSFRNNLRIWLSKVYGLSNKPKKTASSIAKKLTNFEMKGSKEMIQEMILNNLYSRFEEMKDNEKDSNDGMRVIQAFLKENELTISDKLSQMITQHVQRFFSKTQDNIEDYQDYVLNIWNNLTQAYECVCPETTRNLKFSQQKQVCYRCSRSCHVNCFWSKEKKDELYECPMCFLKNCIPNKPVNKILFAGFLRQIKKDKIEYKINLPLENEISEDSIVEVRCVRLCKQNKYEVTWPMNCSVYLNSKKLMEFKPLNINSSIKKRVDDEVVLDKRFLAKRNIITIEEKHQYLEGFRPTVYENHLVLVCQVRSLSIEQITAQTMQQRMSVEQSKQLLREYLDRGMHDCFIDQLKIKLKCQFYNGKITIPARSKHCTSHYQPFDLRGYIMANINLRSSAQRWRCPICRERAYHLLVDDYLLDFISSRKDLTEIQFNNKGDYKMVQQQQQSDNQSEKAIDQKGKFSCEVIQCQMDQQLNHNPNAMVESEKQKQFIQLIEIESEADGQKQFIQKPKRSFDMQEDVEVISMRGPQKKRKTINNQNKSNPLSFLRVKKTSNMKEDSEISDNDELNIESKYSPNNSLSDFKPDRKEKKERKNRKDRVFEEEARKDIDKMSKILVSSPAISTVVPEATKILEKKLPEVSKKVSTQISIIDIDSESENEQTEQARRELKMKHHLKELNIQKNFLMQKEEKIQITPSDESFFLSLCEKFMTASIKGY